MGYTSVFESLKELFPQIDARILKTVALEHPRDADEAAAVVVTEVVPLFSSNLGDNFSQSEDEILENPPVCKVEPEEEGMSLSQWLQPSKVPQSYLALLNEESTPDEKPDVGYVVEKIVLPSPDVGGGIRTIRSASEKDGISSQKTGCSTVKPSLCVQSCTNSDISGSSGEVPVGRRSTRKSPQPRSQFYVEKLRSWKKQSNNNKNSNHDSPWHYGKYRDGSPKQYNRNKKRFSADVRRKKRISDNIKALAKLLPNEVEDDTPETILNEIVSHLKILQLQMKELSRSRLGGELVSHPMAFIEGYGHYIHYDETMTKPLEELIEDLLVNDPDGAASLLESKGLHLMPLSTVQGLC